MNNQNDFYIGKCIYCGSQGETDEHIVPYALGGKCKLLKASCEACRDVTSRFERSPLKESWVETRAVLDYPSRRRDFSKEIFPLRVVFNDDTEGVLNLPKKEALGLTPFLEYSLPVFFNKSKGSYQGGIVVTAHRIISFGPDAKELAKKYDFKEMYYRTTHENNDFENMIARIAYCAAVAVFGVDTINEKFVLPTILNQKDDIGHWMGCDPAGKFIPLIGKVKARNYIKVGVWSEKARREKYILVRLKFFANSDTPEYIVVVGTLDDNCTPSEHKTFINE